MSESVQNLISAISSFASGFAFLPYPIGQILSSALTLVVILAFFKLILSIIDALN